MIIEPPPLMQSKPVNSTLEKFKVLGLPTHLVTGTGDFNMLQSHLAGFPLPWGVPLMRINYFVFAFATDARGHYVIDDQTFPFEPCSVFFTNPGHYRSVWFDELKEYWTITFSESFLKENTHANIFEEFPFLLSDTYPGVVLSRDAYSELEGLYKQMHRECLSASPYRNRIIANLFVVLLLKLKEHFHFDEAALANGGRADDIVTQFKRLLEKHYRELNDRIVSKVFRVQDYASALKLHPVYLSNLVKLKTGKSIVTWISEKNIAEAKSLLKNSALAVNEICYRLGFLQPSHFNNYFKKHTGLSPGSYKKVKQKK